MIRIGPAGIPLSCKGRTLKDGIIYTSSLELDSLEVQFVRGIRMTEEDAAEVGEVALEAGVELHVHAPYYTNLAGDERNVQLTRDKVLKAANLAHIMGARTVVVHPGFYGECTPEEAMERVVRVTSELRDEFVANKWTPKLGLVTMGKRAVFGTIEEIVSVCRQVDGILPVIDFSHIHARGNGSLNTVEDFQDVFDQLIPLGLDHYLIHFTGVAYDNGNERHHLPIKKGDLRFEPLVEVILENDYNVTLISTSPILEHDAMYMQIVLDRVKEKREQRLQKEAQKAREDAEALARGETPAPAEPEPSATPKPKPEPRPPCAALTQAGTECSNLARQGSKYCSSHKGYRPNKVAPEAKKSEKKASKKKSQTKDPEPAETEAEAKTAPKKATKKAGKKVKAEGETAAPAKKASKKASGTKAAKKGAGTTDAGGAAKPKAARKKAPAKKAAGAPAKKATKVANKKAANAPATKKAVAKKKAGAAKKKSGKSGAKKATTAAASNGKSSPSDSSDSASNTKKGVGGRLKDAAQRLVKRK